MEKWFPPSGWVGAGGAGCEERGVYSLPPLQTQPRRIWDNMTRKEGSLDAKASHGRVDMHRAGWEWVWGEFKSGKLKRKVLASANVVCLLLLIFCWHEQWVSGGESSLASCLITPLSQSHAEPSRAERDFKNHHTLGEVHPTATKCLSSRDGPDGCGHYSNW